MCTMTTKALAGEPDPCTFLSDDEIQMVQSKRVVDRVPSTLPGSGFQVLQCVYKTSDITSSVSITLTRDRGTGAAAQYWREQFHVDAQPEDSKERPPVPVEGLGDEAYWVGDAFSGALYVLAGEEFLRMSAGGIPDQETRKARCIQLAMLALKRRGQWVDQSAPETE